MSTEVKAIADKILPELDGEVDDEENEQLRAELDAIKGEIQLKEDRIQELKQCRTELHCSKVEKVYSFYSIKISEFCVDRQVTCCSDFL